MGANVQWGRTDADLFFNDVDPKSWTPFAVQLDPATGKSRRIDGTVFTVSPDGKQAHVVQPDRVAENPGRLWGRAAGGSKTRRERSARSMTNGLFVTHLATGKTQDDRLDSRHRTSGPCQSWRFRNAERCEFYCFQIRWNPAGHARDGVPALARSGRAERRAAAAHARHHERRRLRHPSRRHAETIRPRRPPPDVGARRRAPHNQSQHPRRHQGPRSRERALRRRESPLDPSGRLRPSLDAPDAALRNHRCLHPRATRTWRRHRAPADDRPPQQDGGRRLRTCSRAAGTARSSRAEFRIDQHPVWDATGRFIVFNGVHERHARRLHRRRGRRGSPRRLARS